MDGNIIELVKLGHERAADLKASCGAVDVRSVAQLISDLASQLEVQLVRSNALAAENAHMQQVIGEVQILYYESDGIVGYHLNGEVAKWDDVMPDLWAETPATDAFLAEVRAQGVEMYAERLTRKAIASGENKNHAYAYLAANFAAQLRKRDAQ